MINIFSDDDDDDDDHDMILEKMNIQKHLYNGVGLFSYMNA